MTHALFHLTAGGLLLALTACSIGAPRDGSGSEVGNPATIELAVVDASREADRRALRDAGIGSAQLRLERAGATFGSTTLRDLDIPPAATRAEVAAFCLDADAIDDRCDGRFGEHSQLCELLGEAVDADCEEIEDADDVDDSRHPAERIALVCDALSPVTGVCDQLEPGAEDFCASLDALQGRHCRELSGAQTVDLTAPAALAPISLPPASYGELAVALVPRAVELDGVPEGARASFLLALTDNAQRSFVARIDERLRFRAPEDFEISLAAMERKSLLIGLRLSDIARSIDIDALQTDADGGLIDSGNNRAAYNAVRQALSDGLELIEDLDGDAVIDPGEPRHPLRGVSDSGE